MSRSGRADAHTPDSTNGRSQKRRARGRCSPSILLAPILCWAGIAGAQAQSPPAAEVPRPPNLKSDIIIVVNGDRITGEIKAYTSGSLIVDTSHEGDVSIKWNKIVSITTTSIFDVELVTGVHHYGSLEPSDPPGKLSVRSADGLVTINFLDVFRLAPVYSSFWRRIDGSVDLGFAYTHASQITQFNMSGNAIYRVKSWTLSTTLSAFYSKQEEVSSSQRANFSLFYIKYFESPWLVAGGLGLDRNLDLGLDLRTIGTLGVGRKLKQTNQTLLIVLAGLSASREAPVTGDSKDSLEAVVAAKYSTFTYDYPKFNLDASLAVYPSLTEGGRVRLEANVKARQEVIRDLYISLSIFDSFDNRDPSTGQSRNDWGPVLSIGWSF